jgi:hypothetical protein
MIQANEGLAPEVLMDKQNQPPARPLEDVEFDRPEIEEAAAYYQRRTAGLWACLATLAVALVVSVGYGYTVLLQEGIQLDQIPGLARSLPAINEHLASVENRLVDSRAAQNRLASKIQQIGVESNAALTATRQQTGMLVAQLQRSVDKEMNQRTTLIQAQLSQMVTLRAADQARLTQVEAELVRERTQLEAARADYAHELASIREQQGQANRELASISSSLPTRQISFSLRKNQSAEIAPGVSFLLTKTDSGHQRFDGWIESTPGKQRVSVQNQGVRNPVVFFPAQDGRAYVLVVTSINEQGAGGYLMIPAGANKPSSGDVVSAADNSVVPVSEIVGNQGNLAER